MRWIHQYNKLLFVIWRIDETYMKIKCEWPYLYRTIDFHGNTFDMCLQKNRDTSLYETDNSTLCRTKRTGYR
ncbi:MAG: DDE-type integrase/transposase/recombinase [Carnobacterium sp.]|nr:DDE-type integrase/transposase/recombinase [Carnobacterium sp.]